MMRVISLGAGVQSTTMALMAAHGKIGPMPNCAIFADITPLSKCYNIYRWKARRLCVDCFHPGDD